MLNILFKLSDLFNNEKIRIDRNSSEEMVIGGIILNRIVGTAYNNLEIASLNKESQRALNILKKSYEENYDDFIEKMTFISTIFNDIKFKYAFLKGAYLIPALYQRGQRISNDIDVLINSKDISNVQSILLENEFVQGFCDESGNIIPANRRQVIESRLNYGETVPFLRYYNGKILEIDLNFSIDFKAKNNDEIVNSLLKNTKKIKTPYFEINTLSEEDFLIHLCCHLYKEATTYDWVINRRDLMLYKFSDINLFLHTYGSVEFFEKLYNRIIELNLEKECYYTFINSSIIYQHILSIAGFNEMLNNLKPESTEYLKRIVKPKDKKTFFYNMSFEEWFLSPNRVDSLTEI